MLRIVCCAFIDFMSDPENAATGVHSAGYVDNEYKGAVGSEHPGVLQHAGARQGKEHLSGAGRHDTRGAARHRRGMRR